MPRAYTRAEPEDRRQSLIEAAARVLAERGASGASVRTICAEAGVSPGLLRHYFDGIDALIAETYAWTGVRVAEAVEAAVQAAGPDPRARLTAYVNSNFRPPIADAQLLATWIAFWSLVKTNAEIGVLHRSVYADFREGLEKLLGECGLAAEAVRPAAIGLTALVDGLWLELCLAPDVFSGDEASAIAEGWIAALVPISSDP